MQDIESMSLSNFIQTFGETLQKRVIDSMKPAYNPAENSPDFTHTRRKPFEVQAHTAQAVFEALKRQGSVYVVGEMDSGKSQISISTISLYKKPQRVLVLAPPHLLLKWEREIKAVIPGVKVVQLTSLKQFLDLRENGWTEPETHEFWILSREKAKLSHSWKPVYILKHRQAQKDGKKVYIKRPACPGCGGWLDKYPSARKREFCENQIFELQEGKYIPVRTCGHPLWEAVAPRRYSLATFIRKWLKGFFDVLVADEVHEYKGDSIQGQALGELASCIHKKILLTGTLLGGYAYNLFNLLWRTHTGQMKSHSYTSGSYTRFQQDYGFMERKFKKTRYEEDYQYGRGKRTNVTVKPLPGISPLLLPHFLLGNAVFIRVADVSDALPPYEEEVISLEMEPQQAEQYRKIESALVKVITQSLRTGSFKNLASYLQGLLLIPDAIYRVNEIKVDDNGIEKIIFNLSVPGIMPKEAELLDIVAREKAEGRKVLVYCVYTGTRDITPRLRELLEAREIKVAVLKSEAVPPQRREEWIEATVKRGCDVLIVNPDCVKTGLDLYQFPTVVFYETGYSIYTLRQASRRSWRIGQTKPVKVYYLCYAGTMQEKALRLIASKLETSLVVEGELSDKGLQALSQAEGSMVLELARALIEGMQENGMEEKESLSDAWSRVRKREIEAELTGVEKKALVREVSKSLSQVGTRTLIVDVIESSKPRRKVTTRLTVQEGEIESLVKDKGKPIQFALF